MKEIVNYLNIDKNAYCLERTGTIIEISAEFETAVEKVQQAGREALDAISGQVSHVDDQAAAAAASAAAAQKTLDEATGVIEQQTSTAIENIETQETASVQSVANAENEAISAIGAEINLGKESLNSHTQEKIAEFNINAEEKTADYNANHTAKLAIIDGQVTEATTQAQSAANSAQEAETSASRSEQAAQQSSQKFDQIEGAVDTGLAALANASNALRNTQVSNCILSYPQKINYELAADGTLTIKAGTTVYVPNGPGVYTPVTLQNDVVRSNPLSTVTGTAYIGLYNTLNAPAISFSVFSHMDSGNSSTPENNTLYYNKDLNTIKYYNPSGNLESEDWSFPFLQVTVDNGVIKSVDQVYDYATFIGHYVFILPGLSGLVPNGLNSDGTLNNSAFTTTYVIRREFTWNISYGQEMFCSSNDLVTSGRVGQYYEQETAPTPYTYHFWLDTQNNIMYRTNATYVWAQTLCTYIGNIYGDETGKISRLEPRPALRVLDTSTFEKVYLPQINKSRIPDYPKKANIENSGTSGIYVALQAGVAYLMRRGFNANDAQLDVYVNGTQVLDNLRSYAGSTVNIDVDVKEGDVITWTTSGGGNFSASFYPFGR